MCSYTTVKKTFKIRHYNLNYKKIFDIKYKKNQNQKFRRGNTFVSKKKF